MTRVLGTCEVTVTDLTFMSLESWNEMGKKAGLKSTLRNNS